MGNILFTKLNLAVLSKLKKMAFYFFSPFDVGDAARFFPLGVECKAMEKLLYS
jgi:hypothetical protein